MSDCCPYFNCCFDFSCCYVAQKLLSIDEANFLISLKSLLVIALLFLFNFLILLVSFSPVVLSMSVFIYDIHL